MDRRGSGLTRIVESYNDYDIKPKFNSDTSSFTVVFPNKGYIKQNEEEIKSIHMNDNIVSDRDYFMIRMYKCLPNNTRKKTYMQIQKLFDIYMYQYEFKRENIEEIFGVKKSRASDIITLLTISNLIETSGPTKYKFKK